MEFHKNHFKKYDIPGCITVDKREALGKKVFLACFEYMDDEGHINADMFKYFEKMSYAYSYCRSYQCFQDYLVWVNNKWPSDKIFDILK